MVVRLAFFIVVHVNYGDNFTINPFWGMSLDYLVTNEDEINDPMTRLLRG